MTKLAKKVMVIGAGHIGLQQVYNLLTGTDYIVHVYDIQLKTDPCFEIVLDPRLKNIVSEAIKDNPSLDEGDLISRIIVKDDIVDVDHYYICVSTSMANAYRHVDLYKLIQRVNEVKSDASTIVIVTTMNMNIFDVANELKNVVYFPEFLNTSNSYLENSKLLRPYGIYNESDNPPDAISLGLYGNYFYTEILECVLYKEYNLFLRALNITALHDLQRVVKGLGGSIDHITNIHNKMASQHSLMEIENAVGVGGECIANALTSLNSNYAGNAPMLPGVIGGLLLERIKFLVWQILKTVEIKKIGFNNVTIFLFGYSFKPNSPECNNTPIEYLIQELTKASPLPLYNSVKVKPEQVFVVDPHCTYCMDGFNWIHYEDITKGDNCIFVKTVNHDEFKDIEFDLILAGPTGDYYG